MATLTAISTNVHSQKSWRPPQSIGFARGEVVLALGSSEIPRATPHLPMGFLRQEDRLEMVALVGFIAGQSLMISPEGRWLADYVPFQLKSYPFALAPAPNGEMALCIIEADGNVVNGSVGHPFFDGAGQLDAVVKQMMDALVLFEKEKTVSRNWAAQLEAVGVLKPWDLNVQTYLGVRQVEGLWQIDESALNALDDAAFLELRKTGALTIAYCQMLSTQNISRLVKLAQTPPFTPSLAPPAMELDFSRIGG